MERRGTSISDDLHFYWTNVDQRQERKHRGMVMVPSSLALNANCLLFKDACSVMTKKQFKWNMEKYEPKPGYVYVDLGNDVYRMVVDYVCKDHRLAKELVGTNEATEGDLLESVLHEY